MEAGKAVLVVGAGDATGGAIARRFAREGFIACVTRRQADKLAPLVERIRAEGGQARGFGSDARDEAAVIALVFARYADAVFDALWVQGRNLADAGVLAATLAEAGFAAEAFITLVGDPEVKAQLIATTDEAVARGVFGAPTCFVGEQMFFGQDRLDFVREALP